MLKTVVHVQQVDVYSNYKENIMFVLAHVQELLHIHLVQMLHIQ